MRGLGWTLIALGLVLALWSFALTTTVHTDATYLAGLGYQDAKDTYNLGLLQQQMMVLHSGIGLFIAGTIAACVGGLKSAMREAGTAKYADILPGGVFESEVAPDPMSPPQGAVTK
jgi:hypothetical protein